MNPSIVTKSILALLLNSIGIVSMRLRRYSSYNFALLMYHRVLPKEKFGMNIQSGMYVEPKTFNIHVQFFKRHFNIIGLSELSTLCNGMTKESDRDSSVTSFPQNDRRRKNDKTQKVWNEKPFCILTFDDGWYDFYEYAYPILKEYQVPVTIFLPTDFIGTKKWLWADRLAMIFYKGKRAKGRGNKEKEKQETWRKEKKITSPSPSLLKRGDEELRGGSEELKGGMKN